MPARAGAPTHRPSAERTPPEVVNLGYVINVIESAPERAAAVQSAWQLAGKLLVVAAQEREEVLRSLPPEERLAGLPPEQRLAGLTPEEIRRYLERLTAGRVAAPRKPRRKK